MTHSSATTATTTATPVPQPSGTSSETLAANTSTFVPPQHMSPEDAKNTTDGDPEEELKMKITESLEAHRIASEATVKMLHRNVERPANASANLSGGNLDDISGWPDEDPDVIRGNRTKFKKLFPHSEEGVLVNSSLPYELRVKVLNLSGLQLLLGI
ncbi:uncharacterized protein EV420DRAFT_1486450 [Desarmillaria tabescens]|uniref:Uncharacterized protein n=1 Tax=Armillaria tabescens TaxID=1929756 RepID=A0AA39JCZ0_ARMTA|nr:uncharacterized protein EV420DRAFT_1486450 [Desarmillaria tabescens]KAK0439059.1 hypothetical protein EV420DRAFT_1486450 [Desarmillaria tabescens]